MTIISSSSSSSECSRSVAIVLLLLSLLGLNRWPPSMFCCFEYYSFRICCFMITNCSLLLSYKWIWRRWSRCHVIFVISLKEEEEGTSSCCCCCLLLSRNRSSNNSRRNFVGLETYRRLIRLSSIWLVREDLQNDNGRAFRLQLRVNLFMFWHLIDSTPWLCVPQISMLYNGDTTGVKLITRDIMYLISWKAGEKLLNGSRVVFRKILLDVRPLFWLHSYSILRY